MTTHTRMLTRAAHDLGHEVGVLYSTSFTPAKDPLLREIAFFDEKRPGMSGKRKPRLRRALNHATDQTRYHLPVKPLPVELSGAVVVRQFKRALAAHDRIFVARNYLRMRKPIFLVLRCSSISPRTAAGDILHRTYPLPLRAKSARNVYTIRDLVPLRLPFTTEDNERQLVSLVKKTANEADHIVTVPKTPSVTSSSSPGWGSDASRTPIRRWIYLANGSSGRRQSPTSRREPERWGAGGQIAVPA